MHRTRFRLAAVLGSIVLTMLAAEVGLRIASPAAIERQGFPAITEVDSGGPYFRMRASTEFTHTWDGDPYGTLPEGALLTYRIDAAGYRSGAAGGHGTSLVVLGDSFTFGEGVEVEDRFTEILGPDVFNAGVPGWSTLDEVAVLPELLAARGPRAVLIVVQPNDAVPIPHAQQHTTGDLLALGATGSGSRLLTVLRSGAASQATEEWYLSYWTGERREFGGEVTAALVRAAELCRTRDVRFGVAAFPILHRLDEYPFDDVTQVLREACKREGIAFLDLLPAFEGAEASALWVHPADHHPNAAAHARVAAALRPFVADLLR
jgi:hypothetical protein